MKQHFGASYRALMRAKLGLAREEEGDDQLIGDLLTLMAQGAGRLHPVVPQPDRRRRGLAGAVRRGAVREAEAWLARYRVRTEGEDLSRP